MMKPMFAPWRMTYIKSEKPDGCVFCKDSIRSDDLVLLEGESAFVMLKLPLLLNAARHITVSERVARTGLPFPQHGPHLSSALRAARNGSGCILFSSCSAVDGQAAF